MMWLPVPERLPLYVVSFLFLKIPNFNPTSIKGILRKLYHYNHRNENWNLNTRSKPVQSSSTAPSHPTGSSNSGISDSAAHFQSKSLHNWGGPLTRHALQAIYTLAFICLLRSDEVLKIQRDHIEFVKDDNDSEYMVLTLPFRKTHQDGRMFFFLLEFF